MDDSTAIATEKEKGLKILFPHESIRPIQSDLILAVNKAVKNRSHLIAHAPTGLGKTAASLSPALSYAIEEGKTVFFLTSRHTQHKIVIETLRSIREKYSQEIISVDIIGKRWMCPVPKVSELYSNEFSEFCKKSIEENSCEFYTNTKENNKFTIKAKKLLSELSILSPIDTDSMMHNCSFDRFCPYEISIGLAKKAKVIVADYYYIFNAPIMDRFLARTGKKLEDSIIIIDEGHNLPERIRELMTNRLSTLMMQRAIKEAKKHGYSETIAMLQDINNALTSLAKDIGPEKEKKIGRKEFIGLISENVELDEVITDLEFIGDEIRKQQKQSYIGSVASFLESWTGEDKGFARFISIKDSSRGPLIQLTYRCLDPALISSAIIAQSHSTILMSGTLNPTYMYRDMLGFPKGTEEKEFPSPFPKDNRLSLIIPKTTTRFTSRNDAQYREIAEICKKATDLVPGNSAIFFPSYYLRDRVYSHFSSISEKTAFLETSGMSRDQKNDMLEQFKGCKDKGAILLGASTGSFGEGIDLPGDLLKCVIIVGLPLQKPDLETQELIAYFNSKFSKGWDYGYVFPAFNRSLQNAGRCIRSQKDKGVIIFLDIRYSQPQYYRCFPKDSGTRIVENYEPMISEFFRRNGS